MDYVGRLQRLHQLMRQEDLDGLLYGVGPNLSYFTGLPALWRLWRRESEPARPEAILAVAPDGEPQLLLTGRLANLTPAAPIATKVVSSEKELAATLAGQLGGKRIGTSRPAAVYLNSLVE